MEELKTLVLKGKTIIISRLSIYENKLILIALVGCTIISLLSCKFKSSSTTPPDDTLKTKPCGFIFLPRFYFPSNLKNPDSTIIKLVENILDATGMHLNNDNKNFYLAESDTFKNALAIPKPLVTPTKYLFIHRYIIYDPVFIAGLVAHCSPASAYVIFSHEISHHLNGDSFMDSESSVDRRQRELAADSFAGFLCYKLSLTQHFTLADCVKVYETIGDSVDTDTHPNKKLREQTFTNGWNTSKEYLGLSCDARNELEANPTVAIDEISTSSPAYVSTVTAQSLQAIANVPNKINWVKASTNAEFTDEVINLRGDTSLFVKDKNNRILPVKGIAPKFSNYLTSSKNYLFFGNKVEANQYIIDNKNKIWARYPNGVPYVAGSIKKLN